MPGADRLQSRGAGLELALPAVVGAAAGLHFVQVGDELALGEVQRVRRDEGR
jgi:hypothetical protein